MNLRSDLIGSILALNEWVLGVLDTGIDIHDEIGTSMLEPEEVVKKGFRKTYISKKILLLFQAGDA